MRRALRYAVLLLCGLSVWAIGLMPPDLKVIAIVVAIVVVVVGVVVGAREFLESVESHAERWRKAQPRLARFRRRRAVMSFLAFVCVGASVGALVGAAAWFSIDRVIKEADSPTDTASEATTVEKRRVYATFLERFDSFYTSAMGRRPDLNQQQAEFEKTLNELTPLLGAEATKWRIEAGQFRAYMFELAADLEPRTAEKQEERALDLAVYRENFQGGLLYALFGGEPFKRVTRADVVAIKTFKPPHTAATNRPWLTIKGVKFDIREGHTFAVRVSFSNTGQVPASDIVSKGRIGLQRPAPLVLSMMPPLVAAPGRSVGVMAVGQIADKDDTGSFLIMPVHISDLTAGRAAAYAYGVIEYKTAGDPNSPVWETGYCYRATAKDLGGLPEVYSEGNYAK